MPEKTWKQVERKVAEYFGGRRVPITGRTRGDVPDVRANGLCIEVKERQAFPKWVENAMEQATMAGEAGQIPIVFLHRYGDDYDNGIVMLHASHFRELLALYNIVSADSPTTIAEYLSLLLDKDGALLLIDELREMLGGGI